MSDDERAIRDLVETWLSATKAGDAETVLGLMSDDVVFMAPGAEPFGKEAFAAALEGMGMMTIEGSSDIHELAVLGDIAYLRNRIEMIATAPDGKATRRSGWTLTILRKGSDGRWRLSRDANLLATQA